MRKVCRGVMDKKTREDNRESNHRHDRPLKTRPVSLSTVQEKNQESWRLKWQISFSGRFIEIRGRRPRSFSGHETDDYA